MIKELIKIANELDRIGLTKEADVLDSVINKIADKSDDWQCIDLDSEADDSEPKTDEYIEEMETTELTEEQAEDAEDRHENIKKEKEG